MGAALKRDLAVPSHLLIRISYNAAHCCRRGLEFISIANVTLGQRPCLVSHIIEIYFHPGYDAILPVLVNSLKLLNCGAMPHRVHLDTLRPCL